MLQLRPVHAWGLRGRTVTSTDDPVSRPPGAVSGAASILATWGMLLARESSVAPAVSSERPARAAASASAGRKNRAVTTASISIIPAAHSSRRAWLGIDLRAAHTRCGFGRHICMRVVRPACALCSTFAGPCDAGGVQVAGVLLFNDWVV